jgi:hypothetical protein
VVTWDGTKCGNIRNSWETARKAAGLDAARPTAHIRDVGRVRPKRSSKRSTVTIRPSTCGMCFGSTLRIRSGLGAKRPRFKLDFVDDFLLFIKVVGGNGLEPLTFSV